MSYLIKDGTLVETKHSPLPSLEAFLADRGKAVLLEADEEVETITEHLADIEVIALSFPVFSDGRAYSSATILRRTYGFTGEIIAVGDVRIDQLEQMVRCGFDAFELPGNQNSERALEKLKGFPFSYQSTIDRKPLFTQRP